MTKERPLNRENARQVDFAKRILRDLYFDLGLMEEFDPSLDMKQMKMRLVYDLLAFRNTPDFNLNHLFIPSIYEESEAELTARFVEVITDYVKNGKILHIRFRNGGKVSNNKMVYIRSMEELAESYNEDDLTFTATDGSLLKIQETDEIDIFHQRKGDAVHLSHVENVEESEKNEAGTAEINMGGGLRMELEKIEGDYMIFAIGACFNDVGSRSTAQETEFDKKQPFFKGHIKLSINNDSHHPKFILEGNKGEGFAEDNPSKYIYELLKEVLEKNSIQIFRLFQSLVRVDPVFRKHSLEIAFSRNDEDWNYKITSFDGILTYRDWMQNGFVRENGNPEITSLFNMQRLMMLNPNLVIPGIYNQAVMALIPFFPGQEERFPVELIKHDLERREELAIEEDAVFELAEDQMDFKKRVFALISKALEGNVPSLLSERIAYRISQGINIKALGMQRELNTEIILGRVLKNFILKKDGIEDLETFNLDQESKEDLDFEFKVLENPKFGQKKVVYVEVSGFAMAFFVEGDQLLHEKKLTLAEAKELLKGELKEYFDLLSIPDVVFNSVREGD